MASISSVITGGFGAPGSASLVITDGFGTAGVVVQPDVSEGGYGPGWAIDFAGIEARIDEERKERAERRETIERIYRKATGQPLTDDAQLAALPTTKPAQRARIKTIEREQRAIAEIDASIDRLERQIEQADMAALLAEERDVLWIVSEVV